jgi:hypothetical protein|tara:strand:+ start:559 stop:906 length:348 start_codon:yes stop_codon:yes gene_type:complete
MAHKVVKYRLESDGTIPTWLKFKVPQLTSGMYPVQDPDTASPQDWIIIGISDDGADISNAIEEITSKADLTTYLTSTSVVDGVQKWTTEKDGSTTTFNPATAANEIWDTLNELNE